MSDAADNEAPTETWPLTITLAHPIDFGRERVTSLVMRRGKLGDLKGIKLGEDVSADSLMIVASRMCGQHLKVIESLDPDDAAEVVSRVLDFFGKCLAGGRTS